LRLKELYETRDRLYRQTAHFVVETGRPTVFMLVGSILKQLEQAGVLSLS
jgi:shikimate kinase